MTTPSLTALPSLRPPPQYEAANTQLFDSYDMASHETPEAVRNPYPDHNDYYDDMLRSTVPSTPSYPPASPAYSGYEALRQSIHPMGPDPGTPTTMSSPAYQYHYDRYEDTFSTFGIPGYSTAPANDSSSNSHASSNYGDYRYPEPQQRREAAYYPGIIPETPTSPSSPMHAHASSAPSAEMAEPQARAPGLEREVHDAAYSTGDAYPTGYGYGYGYGGFPQD